MKTYFARHTLSEASSYQIVAQVAAVAEGEGEEEEVQSHTQSSLLSHLHPTTCCC